jgi:hypothetical protein
MQTINALLPVLYIITLGLCALSFTALFLTIIWQPIKAIKNFIF